MPLLDARVEVAFGRAGDAQPDDAMLFEGEAPGGVHPSAGFTPAERCAPGCRCCAPRTAAGVALSGLLHARARGSAGFFRRVVVVTSTAAGRAEVEAALDEDPVVSACFRRGG